MQSESMQSESMQSESMQSKPMQSKPIIKYNLIVAMCKNKGIGYKGYLPWPFIKEDMHFFSKMTRGKTQNNCIIMGRNTWDSLPGKRPLPYRDNLVLSSTLELNECMPDEHVTKSFKTLDDLDSYCKEQKYDTCWVIGGAIIYEQFLERNLIEKCYITYIDMEYKCDVFFNFPEKEWHMLSETISEIIRETSLCETNLSETISETSLYETICLKFQIFIPSILL